jgi:hypothetical protein
MNFISSTHVVSAFPVETLCKKRGFFVRAMDDRLRTVAKKYEDRGYRLVEYQDYDDMAVGDGGFGEQMYRWWNDRFTLIQRLPPPAQTVPLPYTYWSSLDDFLHISQAALFQWPALSIAEVIGTERAANRLSGFSVTVSPEHPRRLNLDTVSVRSAPLAQPKYAVPLFCYDSLMETCNGTYRGLPGCVPSHRRDRRPLTPDQLYSSPSGRRDHTGAVQLLRPFGPN